MPQDFLGIEKQLPSQLGTHQYFSLAELAKKEPSVKALPYSIRILLENVIRNYDGFAVTEEHINTVLNWKETAAVTLVSAMTCAAVAPATVPSGTRLVGPSGEVACGPGDGVTELEPSGMIEDT